MQLKETSQSGLRIYTRKEKGQIKGERRGRKRTQAAARKTRTKKRVRNRRRCFKRRKMKKAYADLIESVVMHFIRTSRKRVINVPLFTGRGRALSLRQGSDSSCAENNPGDIVDAERATTSKRKGVVPQF